jgi:hypothetical protein
MILVKRYVISRCWYEFDLITDHDIQERFLESTRDFVWYTGLHTHFLPEVTDLGAEEQAPQPLIVLILLLVSTSHSESVAKIV